MLALALAMTMEQKNVGPLRWGDAVLLWSFSRVASRDQWLRINGQTLLGSHQLFGVNST